MPVPTKILEELATQLAPGVEFLLPATQLAKFPPMPTRDAAGIRDWLGALDDDALGEVLAMLPKSQVLVEAALRALAKLPALPVAMPLLGEPPHITGRAVAIVDRHEVWSEILSLQASTKRILLLRGDPRSGKSHLRWLVNEHCDQNDHVYLYVDLEDLQTVERAVTLGLNSQLTVPIVVEPKSVASTADTAWARAIGKTVFTRIRAQFPGKTPWLVFDHFDRMPSASLGEAGTFFDTLVDQVARQSTKGPDAATAMRLVMIDRQDIAGDAMSRTIIRRVQRVSPGDIERFIRACKPAISAGDLAAKVQSIVSALREKTYMDDLGENLGDFVGTV